MAGRLRDHEAAVAARWARELQSEATVGPTVGAVVERGVHVSCEGSICAGYDEAEISCVGEICGEAANLAPSVAGDAAIVDEAGQNFEGEYHFGAYRGDEACEADDPACVVKMLGYKRVL